MKRILTIVVAMVAAASIAAIATAEEPPHTTFAPAPPGSVVQSQLTYIAGQAMHSQWRGVLSKAAVGKGNGETFYQWYLSLYRIDGTTYKLQWQSPKDGGPFDKVEKAHGANMWFPRQGGSIVGSAPLMGPGAEELVVATHQQGADCGTARVDVLFFDAAMQQVMTALTVENGCDLSAKIVKGANGTATLQMTGPYYAKNAALCCPTKAKATATFAFKNGSWKETPNYFKIVPSVPPKASRK
jgi:hypothetical protein